MALYLGNEKLNVVFTKSAGSNDSVRCVQGTVVSDANGVVTFPELDFTPSVIAVWNITQVENGDGETSVRYLYTGVMLMAINRDGYWISQGLADGSGQVYITNASADGGTQEFFPENASSGIAVNGNIYSYQLARFAGQNWGEDNYCDLTNAEFNYAIYG